MQGLPELGFQREQLRLVHLRAHDGTCAGVLHAKLPLLGLAL